MKHCKRALLAVYLAFAAVALLDMLLTVLWPEREMVVAKMLLAEILRIGGLIAGFIEGGV